MHRNQDRSRRTVNMEETSSKAMVAIDGTSFDWSYMADDEVPLNMALMVFSDSEITDKSRKGMGFVSYNDVPPPLTGLFLPPKLDLSNSGLEEFQQPEFEGYGPKTSKSVSEDISNKVRESPDAPLVEKLVSDDKLEKKTIFPTVAKIEFVRPKQQEKLVKKPVKYAKMYSLFCLWRFDHVQADCNYHHRERVVSGNNYTKVDYNYSAKKAHPSAHMNMVPKAVLMKNGLRPLNTVRPVNTAHPKTTVYSARPMSRFLNQHNHRLPKAVNTARPNSAVVDVVKANQGHTHEEDQGYVDNGCSRHMTENISYLSDFKKFDRGYVTFGGGAKGGKITESFNLSVGQGHSIDESMLWHRRLGHGHPKKEDQGYIDSGCSRHMTGNMSYLSDFTEFDGGYVTFGEGAKRGKITIVAGTNSNDFVDGSLFDSSSKNASNVEPQPSSDAEKKDDGCVIATARSNDSQTEPDMFSLRDNPTLEATHVDFFGDETEVDMSNITTTYLVPSTPNTRIYKDHSLDHVIGDIQSGVQTRRMTKATNEQGFISVVYEGKTHEDLYTCLFACFLSQEEPKRISKALSDPAWVEAMQEELLQFKLQKVWVLVDLPKEEGIDYDEVFAPIARIEAIRLFLAYASFMGFMVYQMDVKIAFLYGRIKEEVYVCQPLGFKDPDYPDKVYKVVKALYGLHQAPKAWYETLAKYLLDNVFHRGKIDQTLFIKKQKGDILLVHVYVDDIIIGSTKKELCTEFEKLMHDGKAGYNRIFWKE
ncbi:putative ribonuclease H-like domain-containing protein, partial [Tanacetum coccineum]